MNERLVPESPEVAAVLAIGGTDPTGAAGVAADLKTLSALGVYGAAAVTAVTVQTTEAVSDVVAMPASLVGAQIDAALVDVAVDAVKTGMLANVDIVHAVADRVERQGPGVRWIIDPVLASSSGRELLGADGRKALVERLIPRAALVTPNLGEASILTGIRIESAEHASMAADHFLALGASAVLIKGGHWPDLDPELEEVTDLLRTADGDEWRFTRPRLPGAYRGTGCTLATAIAAHVAEGRTLRASVEQARDFLELAMRSGIPSKRNGVVRLPMQGGREQS